MVGFELSTLSKFHEIFFIAMTDSSTNFLIFDIKLSS